MIRFKTLKIKGYKSFIDSGEIDLRVPNGEPGSGLNIMVGENGVGKTAVLKAISLLSSTSFSGQHRVASSDFNKTLRNDEPIEIIASLHQTIKYAMPSPWKSELDIKEFHVTAKHRDRKSPGKLLSSQFSISNILEPTTRTIPRKGKGEDFIVTDFYLSLDNERLGEEALNIFYFDLDRSRQAKTGFSTTFTRVMDDLNWKFLNTADHAEILNKWKEYYSQVVKQDVGKTINDLLSTRFNRPDLAQVKLELLNLEEPFSTAFLGIPTEDKLTQIPISELGSGVELIFAILFLKQIANQSKGTVIYCIDEPELSLHPQWQKIFFEILKEESANKQIFIATHSPYFFDPFTLKNVKKVCSEKDGGVSIRSLSEKTLGDHKSLDLFNLENREILFSRSVILVEGWEDRDRMRKLLQKSDKDMFVIVGLQNFVRVKDICSSLGIQFKAIVDLDYLRNYTDLIPVLTQQELDALQEVKALDEVVRSTSDEIVKKEANKIRAKIESGQLCILSSKIKARMLTDATYSEKIRAKIETLKSEGTYVLPSGVIEDYLDESGTPKSDTLRDELLQIIET